MLQWKWTVVFEGKIVYFSKVMLLQPEKFHTSNDTILSLFQPSYILKMYKAILMLFFHLLLVYPSGCFLRHFPTKIMYPFFAPLSETNGCYIFHLFYLIWDYLSTWKINYQIWKNKTNIWRTPYKIQFVMNVLWNLFSYMKVWTYLQTVQLHILHRLIKCKLDWSYLNYLLPDWILHWTGTYFANVMSDPWKTTWKGKSANKYVKW